MPVERNVKAIDALKPRAERYDESVTGRPGLVVRVWPSGKKVLLHRFKMRNIPHRLTLGEYPATSLQAFLATYESQRAQIARGENPAAQAEREAHARAQVPTVANLAHRYLEEYARPNKRSAKADELILKRDVLPFWGKLNAQDITEADVDTRLAKIKADKSRGVTAPRKALAVVRKMLSWGIKKRLLKINPARGIDIGKPPAARTRALSDSELRMVQDALPSLPLSEAMKDALLLQLLTGTRIGEPLGAHQREFDLDAPEWLVPGERTKNGLPLCVPLTNRALVIIKCRLDTSADGLLFPGNRAGTALTVSSLGHALKRELANIKSEDGRPIAPFTSQDLRRTVETGLARLGVPREIRDRVLNHKDSSVGAVHYNQHDYLPEKRAALEAWARKLDQIASGKESTVTPLRRTENRRQRG